MDYFNNWYQSSRLVDPVEVNASIVKVDVVKFDRTDNFRLWQRRVKDLSIQQGLVKVLYGKTKKPEKMIDDECEGLQMMAVSTIWLCLADKLMYNVLDEVSNASM